MGSVLCFGYLFSAIIPRSMKMLLFQKAASLNYRKQCSVEEKIMYVCRSFSQIPSSALFSPLYTHLLEDALVCIQRSFCYSVQSLFLWCVDVGVPWRHSRNTSSLQSQVSRGIVGWRDGPFSLVSEVSIRHSCWCFDSKAFFWRIYRWITWLKNDQSLSAYLRGFREFLSVFFIATFSIDPIKHFHWPNRWRAFDFSLKLHLPLIPPLSFFLSFL